MLCSWGDGYLRVWAQEHHPPWGVWGTVQHPQKCLCHRVKTTALTWTVVCLLQKVKHGKNNKNRDCKASCTQNCHGVDRHGTARGPSTLKPLGVGRFPPCGWHTHAQSSPVPGHSQILLVISQDKEPKTLEGRYLYQDISSSCSAHTSVLLCARML